MLKENAVGSVTYTLRARLNKDGHQSSNSNIIIAKVQTSFVSKILAFIPASPAKRSDRSFAL